MASPQFLPTEQPATYGGAIANGGSNQYASYPSLPGSNTYGGTPSAPTGNFFQPTSSASSPYSPASPLQGATYGGGSGAPGTVPSTPGTVPGGSGSSYTYSQNLSNPSQFDSQYPSRTQPAESIGHGQYSVPPTDASLQNSIMNYLQGQVGQGMSPFNLQALLPTGGTTGAGQVSSPLDPLSQAMMQFYSTGATGGNPGLQSLSQLASTGDPIDQTPAWQAMVQQMQQQIGTGAANVREQMSFSGNLPGSAGALATSEYQNQSTADLNSQLLSAQTQAQQQAVQNKLTASGQIQSGEQSLASSLYGYDQSAVTNLMNEFFATQSQENPTLGYQFGGGTAYAPTFGKTQSPSVLQQILSGVAGIAGAAAPLAAA